MERKLEPLDCHCEGASWENPNSVQPPVHQWKEVVATYWKTLGVEDKSLLAGLTQEVIQRVTERAKEGDVLDTVRLAIEEIQCVIDERLVSALDLDDCPDPETLTAARAALLDPAVKEAWLTGCLDAENSCGRGVVTLDAVRVRPTPALMESAMPEQKLECLFLSRIARYCLELTRFPHRFTRNLLNTFTKTAL